MGLPRKLTIKCDTKKLMAHFKYMNSTSFTLMTGKWGLALFVKRTGDVFNKEREKPYFLNQESSTPEFSLP